MKEKVKKIMSKLINNGYQAYFVGGYVRDIVLNNSFSDIDIATNAKPEEVISLFDEVIPTGIKHGTVTVVCDKELFEVTTFRSDGKYSDGRHPDKVSFVNTLEEDLSRRDFTINSMAMDINEKIVDIFGGEKDLKLRLIKAVGNPDERFKEDPLRMLRAVRFSAKLGFNIERYTKMSIRKNCDLIKSIARERIDDELKKIILSDNIEIGLTQLKQTGLYKYVFGDIKHNDNYIKFINTFSFDFASIIALIFQDVSFNKLEKFLSTTKYDNKTKKKILAIYDGLNREFDDIYDRRIFVKDYGRRIAKDLFLLLYIQNKCTHFSYYNVISVPCSIKELPLNGHDIIKLGISDGVKIGKILNELLDYQMHLDYRESKEELLKLAKSIK